MAMLVEFKCLDCGRITQSMVMHLNDETELKCEYCGSTFTEIIRLDSI